MLTVGVEHDFFSSMDFIVIRRYYAGIEQRTSDLEVAGSNPVRREGPS